MPLHLHKESPSFSYTVYVFISIKSYSRNSNELSSVGQIFKNFCWFYFCMFAGGSLAFEKSIKNSEHAVTDVCLLYFFISHLLPQHSLIFVFYFWIKDCLFLFLIFSVVSMVWHLTSAHGMDGRKLCAGINKKKLITSVDVNEIER